MQVMSFNEKKNKYVCLDVDEYCMDDESVSLTLVSEEDLSLFENYDKEYAKFIKESYNNLFPEDLNQYCYELYEILENGETVLVRKAFLRKRKLNDNIKFSI